MLKDKKSLLSYKTPNAALVLEDGQIFFGQNMGFEKNVIGELCFNTSQTGYQEILTDPSYAKQIITFTFPHIGIVGSNENDNESLSPSASGCIISSDIHNPSNWRSKLSFINWLHNNKLPCITNLDTRYITKTITKKGAQKAAIVCDVNIESDFKEVNNQIKEWSGLENLDLAKLVSTKKQYNFNETLWNFETNNHEKINHAKKSHTVVCIDYGAKKNIFRSLVSRNLNLTIVPADYSYKQILNLNPSGIFLSNGPGDPFATGKYAINTIEKLVNKKIPIFGICLGHQILSLTFGAKTKKMYRGHRGANHPVENLETKKVEITSQNHGFEVLANSFPKEIIETHISLFDKTNEGMKHKFLPVFSVQYHPESSPGPHDSRYLFDKFYESIIKYAKEN